MKILLDTHIVLWALYDTAKLSEKAKDIILNPQNIIYFSPVTSWEVFLKYTSNPKSNLPPIGVFLNDCQQAGYTSLGLFDRHIASLETIKKSENTPDHKDPFDKLLIAQAKSENMLFLTHDQKLTFYNEPFVVLV